MSKVNIPLLRRWVKKMRSPRVRKHFGITGWVYLAMKDKSLKQKRLDCETEACGAGWLTEVPSSHLSFKPGCSAILYKGKLAFSTKDLIHYGGLDKTNNIEAVRLATGLAYMEVERICIGSYYEEAIGDRDVTAIDVARRIQEIIDEVLLARKAGAKR